MEGRGRRATRLAVGLAAAGLAMAAGCGGTEEARPSGASMASGPQSDDASRNAAPVIERVALSPRDPEPGVPVEAVVEARDPDGDPVQLHYTWRLNGEVVARGRRARFEPGGARAEDRIEVEVVASDGRLESEPRRARQRFANRPPKVRSVALDAEGALEPGSVVTALVDARDPDEDSLGFEYEWLVNGAPVDDAAEKTFSTEGLERGDAVAVRVVARDGREASEPATSPALEIGNSAPRFGAVPAPTREKGIFKWNFEASDPDGDRGLRFELAEGPEGMTMDPILGVVHWRPTAEQVGTHPVEVRVTDGAGATSGLRFEATVSAEAVGRAAPEGAEGGPPAARAP